MLCVDAVHDLAISVCRIVRCVAALARNHAGIPAFWRRHTISDAAAALAATLLTAGEDISCNDVAKGTWTFTGTDSTTLLVSFPTTFERRELSDEALDCLAVAVELTCSYELSDEEQQPGCKPNTDCSALSMRLVLPGARSDPCDLLLAPVCKAARMLPAYCHEVLCLQHASTIAIAKLGNMHWLRFQAVSLLSDLLAFARFAEKHVSHVFVCARRVVLPRKADAQEWRHVLNEVCCGTALIPVTDLLSGKSSKGGASVSVSRSVSAAPQSPSASVARHGTTPSALRRGASPTRARTAALQPFPANEKTVSMRASVHPGNALCACTRATAQAGLAPRGRSRGRGGYKCPGTLRYRIVPAASIVEVHSALRLHHRMRWLPRAFLARPLSVAPLAAYSAANSAGVCLVLCSCTHVHEDSCRARNLPRASVLIGNMQAVISPGQHAPMVVSVSLHAARYRLLVPTPTS